MKNTLLFILLLAALSFSACEKEKTPPTELEKLPAATQEGKNTFGCLVDGKAWTPKWGGLINPGITPYYNNVLGRFTIDAAHYSNQKLSSGVWITGDSIWGPGVYNLVHPLLSYIHIDSACGSSGPQSHEYHDNINGTIQITRLDVSTGIISGTFEFDAVSETCQDTVHISDGRFDIKYK
ncbi:MAG: hypothetical protein J0L99_05190 [Chitinophagales bacterium]|nr:hypothetical protein [Chitinophagales bacterium]